MQKMRAKSKLETSTLVTSDGPFTSLQSFGKDQKDLEYLCHDGVGAVLKWHVWKKVMQKQIIVINACDFHADVNSDRSNVKCLYASEKKIQTQIPQTKFFFDTLKPLHGIKMAHSIRKTHYLCVNMYANTGNILSYV